MGLPIESTYVVGKQSNIYCFRAYVTLPSRLPVLGRGALEIGIAKLFADGSEQSLFNFTSLEPICDLSTTTNTVNPLSILLWFYHTLRKVPIDSK